MAGFTGYDQVLEAVTVNGYMQKLQFSKLLPSTTVALVPHTLWKATGLPVAGADPTVGVTNAVKCSSATAGAMPYTNAGGGRTMHLTGITDFILTTQDYGTLMLVDRLAHANISIDQATASFSPVIDGTDRLASGEGAQIIMEVTTQLSAAANGFTLTYTDEGGVSSTTPTITTVASAVVGRVPYASYTFVPLAAGDLGARTITDITHVSGTATGAVNIVLIKPLALIQVSQQAVGTSRDFILELPLLQKIQASSCLAWYFFPASAGTSTLHGEVRIIEN